MERVRDPIDGTYKAAASCAIEASVRTRTARYWQRRFAPLGPGTTADERRRLEQRVERVETAVDVADDGDVVAVLEVDVAGCEGRRPARRGFL